MHVHPYSATLFPRGREAEAPVAGRGHPDASHPGRTAARAAAGVAAPDEIAVRQPALNIQLY